MNEKEYNSYMQAIAQSLKAIADDPTSAKRRFATIEEVWDSQRAGIDYDSLIMVVMREEILANNIGTGNMVEYHALGFWLVRKCKAGDFEQYRQAYEDSLSAARSIIGKMVKDKTEGNETMMHLDLSKVQYKKAGPIFGGICYGTEITFGLSEKAACHYEYKEEQWNL